MEALRCSLSPPNSIRLERGNVPCSTKFSSNDTLPTSDLSNKELDKPSLEQHQLEQDAVSSSNSFNWHNQNCDEPLPGALNLSLSCKDVTKPQSSNDSSSIIENLRSKAYNWLSQNFENRIYSHNLTNLLQQSYKSNDIPTSLNNPNNISWEIARSRTIEALSQRANDIRQLNRGLSSQFSASTLQNVRNSLFLEEKIDSNLEAEDLRIKKLKLEKDFIFIDDNLEKLK